MQTTELATRQAFAESLARQAGWAAREFYENPDKLLARLKGAQDFITEADGAIEAFLRRKVREAFPDDGFIGEEGGGETSDRLWIVDPIDGTANFAHGEPHWCISIGFLHRGVPVVGVVEAPMLGETFSARRGCGALRNGKAISASQTSEFATATIEIGWSTRRPPADYLRVVTAVMERGASAKRSASGALGLCWAACGRTDAYLEAHINSWDVAAGILIAAEAGAQVNDFFSGNGLVSGNPVLASTPALYPPLARILDLSRDSETPAHGL